MWKYRYLCSVHATLCDNLHACVATLRPFWSGFPSVSSSPHVTLSVVAEVSVVIKGILSAQDNKKFHQKNLRIFVNTNHDSFKRCGWRERVTWVEKMQNKTTTWKQIYCLHFCHVFRHRERHEGFQSLFWTCTWLNPADSGKCNSTSAFWYNSNGLLCLLPWF